ncbi:hypothetical protein Q7P35_001807 [Cladosporium inversicolor]
MPNHTRLIFSVPKPPSKQSTRDNPDETIAWINKRLRELVTAFEQNTDTEPVLDLGAYMVIYSTIHQCTVSTKDHDIDLPGKKLYFGLADIIRSHCRDLRTGILRSHSEAVDKDLAIMETYAREWKRHCKLAKLIAHNYRYMERHWIQRERSNDTPDAHPIQELHSILWREEVAIGRSQYGRKSSTENDDSDSILDIAIRLREREGVAPGEEVNQQASDLLREVFQSFEEIGIKIDLTQWFEDHCPGNFG